MFEQAHLGKFEVMKFYYFASQLLHQCLCLCTSQLLLRNEQPQHLRGKGKWRVFLEVTLGSSRGL